MDITPTGNPKTDEWMKERKEELERLYRERDTAYDGQKRPQDRELLPLERDLLVRVLSDIFHAIRRKDFNNLYSVHRSFTQEEVDILVEVRGIIDPREDW